MSHHPHPSFCLSVCLSVSLSLSLTRDHRGTLDLDYEERGTRKIFQFLFLFLNLPTASGRDVKVQRTKQPTYRLSTLKSEYRKCALGSR